VVSVKQDQAPAMQVRREREKTYESCDRANDRRKGMRQA